MRPSRALRTSPTYYALQNAHVVYLSTVAALLRKRLSSNVDTFHNALHVLKSCDISPERIRKALDVTPLQFTGWATGTDIPSDTKRSDAVMAIIALLEAEVARINKDIKAYTSA